MNRFNLKKTVLTLVAVCGIGFFAMPQQAAAEYVRSGYLSSADRRSPHRPGSREEVHRVRLHAGQTYVIDAMSSSFDTYLFLETSGGTVLRRNDDGGTGLNSRIIFTPSITGTYQISVTSFNSGAGGSYSLRVSP